MFYNAALNAVPQLRAQSAELAQADSGARKCGIKPERSGVRRSQCALTVSGMITAKSVT